MGDLSHRQRAAIMTTIGMLSVVAVAIGMLGSELFRPDFILLPQLWIGIAGCYAAALFVPRWLQRGLRRSMMLRPLFGVYVFWSGLLLGCVANTLIFGPSDWWSYFIKPLYWMGLVGTPCAFGIGFTYFGSPQR